MSQNGDFFGSLKLFKKTYFLPLAHDLISVVKMGKKKPVGNFEYHIFVELSASEMSLFNG